MLVVNQTKVINARLKGKIEGNGKACEIFLHKQLSDDTWDCLIYPGKKLKPGVEIHFPNPDSSESGLKATVITTSEHGRTVTFSER